MTPQVSVVIPTCDRPEDLARAIACALGQSVSAIEVIVSVEAGDTLSDAVLADVKDSRLRVVHNGVRNGPGPNRDNGARAATAPWLAFLDDDDEWAPDKLEKQLALAGPDTILTCLSQVETDQGAFVRPGRPYDGSRPVDEWLFDRQSWLGGGDSFLQTSSLLMPRALFATGGFGTARHEEWELVIRATRQRGYRLVCACEVLVIHREGNRHSWQKSLPWVQSMDDVMSKRAISGFCLNSATQGITGPGRNAGFATYLRAAFRLGRPTAKQLFAFALIWALPHDLRWQIRVAARRLVGR